MSTSAITNPRITFQGEMNTKHIVLWSRGLSDEQVSYLVGKYTEQHEHPDHVGDREFLEAALLTGQIEFDWMTNPFTGRLFTDINDEIQKANEKRLSAKTKGTQQKYKKIINDLRSELNRVPTEWFAHKRNLEQYERRSLRSTLEKMVAKGEAARKKMAENLLKDVWNARHAIEWGGSTVEALHTEEFAAKILEVADSRENGYDLESATIAVGQQLREELLRNSNRGASTSRFSNAVELSRNEAIAKFLSTLHWQGYLREEV